MDKQLILNDKIKLKDSSFIKGSRVIARVPGTDTILWQLQNKVLAAGSAFVAAPHFEYDPNNVPAPVTRSYNTELELEESEPDGAPAQNARKIYLFCIGTDGCGETSAQQYEVDYTKWLNKEDMIPFRYTNQEFTLTERSKYYGKANDPDNPGYSKYYFKAFEGYPRWVQNRTVTGAPIGSDLYEDYSTIAPVQSYVELKLLINSTDCREWFNHINRTNGYVNTFCLLQGWYKTIGDVRYYQGVHPVTKLNFPTEYLIDPSKGLDITYDIFY